MKILNSFQFCRRSYSSTDRWPSQAVRKTFLDYFDGLGYTYVRSAPIVPYDDPNMLFVNAGMNQFKPIFLSTVNPASKRAKLKLAVNTQKCIRASGTRCDLQDVGRDAYHHTFFEMLGNWSFNGHMSKKQVCQQAWTLLTTVYKIPKQRLFVTYFAGNEPMQLRADEETRDVWREIGVKDECIVGKSSEDTFWEMDATGPCGPCTEIFYAPQGQTPSTDSVELWNIVFIQYNKLSSGELKMLPAMHVDTGMGLERLSAILQNADNNYDTDLFRPLIEYVQKRCPDGVQYEPKFGVDDPLGVNAAFRIIADHARMCVVALSDGVVPSNEGAGNVLRQVLRNALHQGTVLGAPRHMLAELTDLVVGNLKFAFSELEDNVEYVKEVINTEEENFLSNLKKAKAKFAISIKDNGGKLSSAEMFQTSETLGLPRDAVAMLVSRAGVKFSVDEFEVERTKFENKSKSKQITTQEDSVAVSVDSLQSSLVQMTDDSPKYRVSREGSGSYLIPPCESKIVAVVTEGRLTNAVPSGVECDLVLDHTPFYAEGGGQAGDEGILSWGSANFKVKQTLSGSGYVLHRGVLGSGGLIRGDTVVACVDRRKRIGCMQHHTATHLIIAVLERFLGHVRQRSLSLDGNQCKLTIWTSSTCTLEIVSKVEEEVKDVIRRNFQVYTVEIPLNLAKQMPFVRWNLGEYYPDPVRLVSVRCRVDVDTKPSSELVSAELCCGTHVRETGDVQMVRMTGLKSSGAGVKEISFVAGASAVAAEMLSLELESEIKTICSEVISGQSSVEALSKIRARLVESIIPLDKRIELLKLIMGTTNRLSGKIEDSSKRCAT